MRAENVGHIAPNCDQPGAIGATPNVVELVRAPEGCDLDAITQMYALLMADSRTDTQSKMGDIMDANQRRSEELEKHITELKAAMKELEDGGFWDDLGDIFGDVAKWTGVVASVALTVATAGAGGPVAALAISALVLSSAAMLEGETGVISDGLVAAGVSEDVAKWVGPAMTLLSAACSFGAAAIGTTANASELVELAKTIGSAASVAAGTSAIISGGSQIVFADVKRDARRHEANAAEAMMRMQLIQQLITQLVEDLEDTGKREASLTKNMTQISELQASSMLMLASGKA